MVTAAVVDYVFLTGAKNKTGNGGQTALDHPVLAPDVTVALTNPVEIPLVGVALGQQHLEILGRNAEEFVSSPPRRQGRFAYVNGWRTMR